MKLLFLSSFIILGLTIAHENKKHARLSEKQKKSFWELELQANSTRKKSLAHLDYITIPAAILSLSALSDNPHVTECMDNIQILSQLKIVNFTGKTNTELKLEYGTANITLLSEYDQNYTQLVRILQKWALLLHEGGYSFEARQLLEFAVSTHTDVSGTYYLLADLYDLCDEPDKKEELIQTAQTLHSCLKDSIVRRLQGSGPYSDLPHSV